MKLQSAHCLVVEIIVAVLEGDRKLSAIPDMAQFNLCAQEVGVGQPCKDPDTLRWKRGRSAEGGTMSHCSERCLTGGNKMKGGDIMASGQHGGIKGSEVWSDGQLQTRVVCNVRM